LLLVFFVFFGILGVQLFQGTTHGQCMIGGWGYDEELGPNKTFVIDGTEYWNRDALIQEIKTITGKQTDKALLFDYDPLYGHKGPTFANDVAVSGMYFMQDGNDEALCALNDWQFWSETGAPLFVSDSTEREFGRKCEDVELGGVTIPRFCARYSWADGAQKGFLFLPTYGTGNFDSFFEACGTMWTSITLEGWVDIMYAVSEGFGQAYLYFGESSGFIVNLYFIILWWLGNLLLLNLVLAVIEEQYSNAVEVDDDEDEAEEGVVYAAAGGGEIENKGNMKSSIVQSGAGSDEGGLIPFFYNITEMAVFQNTVSFAILANSVTMGIHNYQNNVDYIRDNVSYGMGETTVQVLEIFEYTFFVIFWVEMIIKLLGLGPRGYVKDTWNVFDGFIVLMSTVDVILTQTDSDSGGGILSVLKVMRTFRLIRLFKLAFKSWPALRTVVVKIQQTFKTAVYLVALLTFMVFIFGLAGMKIFGGRFGHCGYEGNDDFAKFGLCCTNSQMNFEYGGPDDYGWGQIVFHGLTPCTDSTLLRMGPHSEDPPRHHFDTIFWAMMTVFQVLTGENWNEVFYNSLKSTVLHGDTYEFDAWEYLDQVGVVLYFVCLTIIGQWLILGIFLAILLPSIDEEEDGEIDAQLETKGESSTKVVPVQDGQGDAEGEGNEGDGKKKEGYVLAGKSLGCLSVGNPVRTLFFNAIKYKHFDNFILAVILLSTFLLCYGDPAYTPPWLKAVNLVITIIFLIECCMKIVALGLKPESEHAYLNDGWNVLDFIIVLISIVELALAGQGGGAVSALKALRAMRGLRPLRAVKRYPGMMLVVQTILQSLPSMLAPTMVLVFYYTVLAIMATHIFAGQMNSCNDGEKICRPGVKIFNDHPDLYCNPLYWPPEIKEYYNSMEWFDVDEYEKRFEDSNEVKGEKCLFEIDFPYGLGCHERSLGNLNSPGSTNLICDPEVWREDYPEVYQWASGGASGDGAIPDWDTYTYLGDVSCRDDVDFPFGLKMRPLDEMTEENWEHPDLMCDPSLWPADVYQLAKDNPDLWITGQDLAALEDKWGEGGDCSPYNEFHIRGLSEVNQKHCCDPSVPFPYGLQREAETGPACSGSFLVADTDLCGLLPFTSFVGICQQMAYCDMLDGSELESLEKGTATSICDKMFFAPRKWGPPLQNFDWIWSSFVTTFECTTGEMWPDIMYTTLDTVGVDQPTSYDYRLTIPGLFFVIFVNFGGAMVILNLPIAVVCDNYNEMKENNSGGLLTESQKEWFEKQKAALRARPEKDENLRSPNNPIRAKIYKLVESKWFEMAIIACILLNTLTMMMDAFGDPYRYYSSRNNWSTLGGINFFFGLVFTAEALLKMIAFDVKYLYAAPLTWNQFDFFLVVLFWIEEGNLPLPFQPTFLRVLRVFRVMRLFKVNKDLRKTVSTVMLSIPQLCNVGLVLLLFQIMYSILGKELFWRVKFQENIFEYANFRYFWTSYLLLNRAMSGESYNALMHDCRVQWPYCSEQLLCYHQDLKFVACEGYLVDKDDPTKGFQDEFSSDIQFFVCNDNGCEARDGDHDDLASEGWIVDGYNCGYPFTAQFYFITYFIVIGLMFLGIFVAIILDANAESSAAEGSPIHEEHIDSFKKAWTKLDKNASGYIQVEQLPVLLRKVRWPLGLEGAPMRIAKGKESLKIAKAIVGYSKVQKNGQLFFNDVLSGLVSFALARDEDDCDKEVHVENTEIAMKLLNDQRARKLPRSVTREFKAMEAQTDEKGLTIDIIIATVVIQSYFRRIRSRKNMEKNGKGREGTDTTKEEKTPAVENPSKTEEAKPSPAQEDGKGDSKTINEQKASNSDDAKAADSGGVKPDGESEKNEDNVPGQVNPSKGDTAQS